MRDELYKLWVSADRCTLVRLWPSGVMEVCFREDVGGIWGPPVELEQEIVHA